LVLVGAGLATIPWLTMVSVIVPILAGAVIGNLDEELRAFFASHEPLIIPFLAFTLGQGVNLKAAITAGLPGVLLGLSVVLLTGFFCILADRLLGGSGLPGAAASSTAGNAVATPNAVALADPSYAAIAPIATVQVAASIIVTAVLTPLLTTWIYRRQRRRRALAEQVPVEKPEA
jgi:2-keto-3-deoxygluconate permease